MNQVNRAIQGADNLDLMMSRVLDAVLEVFGCDRAYLIFPCDPIVSERQVPMERHRPGYPGALSRGVTLPADATHSRMHSLLLESEGALTFGPGNQFPGPTALMERYQVKVILSMALRPKGAAPWQFGIHQCTHARVWTKGEVKLFEEIGWRIADGLTALLVYRKVQESEAYLRTLVQAIPDLVWAVNSVDAFLFCNPPCERLFGVANAELVGKTYHHVMNHNQGNRFRLHDHIALSTRLPCVNEEWLTFSDRGYRGLFEIINTPLLDPAGNIIGVLGVGRDITRRKQMEDTLRDFAAYNEATREDERRRIARELHDELGQQLSALRIHVNVLDLRFGKENPPMRSAIDELLGVVDHTIKVTRDVSTSLRPAALDLGIVPAIEWLVMEFTRNTGIPCDVERPAGEVQLSEEKAVALFRITQESLTNVTRHAQADRVQVRLERMEAALSLEVRDDGIGFDPTFTTSKNAFGLIGMRERALAIGAVLSLTSARGQGTLVRVLIPSIPTEEVAP
jgi:PAS domain S-box-containing protein